jgi:hypothetical protein
MKSKKGVSFSFGWMFAIIIGAVIIFLAVYGASRFVGTETKIRDSEIGKEIGIILNPIAVGVEEGNRGKIVFTDETTIINWCDPTLGKFGVQDISVKSGSGLGASKEEGAVSSFSNRYIFSSGTVEGEEYRVFSKSFDFPYKVASVIYLWGTEEKYCFISPPKEIEEEIIGLGLQGVSIVDRDIDCPAGAEEIKIQVVGSKGLQGRVIKGFDEVYFSGSALAFGAVFADKEIYECQVKRLMQRTSELALVYQAKSSYLAPRTGCGPGLGLDLGQYATKTLDLERSFDLAGLSIMSGDIERRNDDLYCKLF